MEKELLWNCIFSSAKVEGLKMSAEQFSEIMTEEAPAGVLARDILFVRNMEDAWEFIHNNPYCDVNLLLVRQLNRICGEGLFYGNGDVRETNIHIPSTSYKPPIPVLLDVVLRLEQLSRTENPKHRAVDLFKYLARAQLFRDGNIRVAQLAANYVLVTEGVGVLIIPPDRVDYFDKVLLEYYKTERGSLHDFLWNECIVK